MTSDNGNYSIIRINDVDLRPSILAQPTDERYLVKEWERARAAFLMHMLTRKGMDPSEQRKNTARTYSVALEQFFDGVYDSSKQVIWPMINPWQVTTTVVRQWKQIMSLVGKPVTRKGKEIDRTGLASATINIKLAALKAFYDFVAHQYEITYQPAQHDPLIEIEVLFVTEDKRNVALWPANWRNPFDAKSVTRPTVQPFGRSVYPSTDEVRAMLDECNTNCLTGKRDYALMLALFSTACRWSEIAELRYGDLKEKENGNYTFSFRGKSGKYESVELQSSVKSMIDHYLQAAGRLEDIQDDEYIWAPIFPNRAKRLNSEIDTEVTALTPISNSQANKIIKKYARRADVDEAKAHLHGLRHARSRQTAQDMKAKNGGVVDIVAINRLLRHANMDTTQIYLKVMNEEPADSWAADAIDAVLPRGDRRRKKSKQKPTQPNLL